MKIKVIDLLNKIANREELPKKIRYKDDVLKDDIIYVYYDWAAGYFEEGYAGKYEHKFLHYRNEQFPRILNLEVEILDKSKGIEKCKSYEEFLSIDEYIEHLKDKINELIEVVNNLDK